MFNATAFAAFCVAAGFGAGQEESYIERMDRALEVCRADLPALSAAAGSAAELLAAGGRLFVAGQPSMISELTGRAGGFMMIRGLGGETPVPSDVVMHFPESERDAPPAQGFTIQFGRNTGTSAACFSSHAEECGLSPTLANAIPGWLYTGELIAALTRLGKIPVIYESIGAYGGNARIVQFKNGEIAWHDGMTVPPAPAGRIGNAFIDAIQQMLRRIEREENTKLEHAGAWVREARERGNTCYMYSMGHLFPDEVEKTAIGKVFRSAVWNAGFRQHPAPEDTYAPGDVCVHIGYQHPPKEMLRRASAAGAKSVYVSILSDRDFTVNPDAIWLDPMWDWPDACVPLEGYDVPLLAASGLVNGAIAWEIWRLGGGE